MLMTMETRGMQPDSEVDVWVVGAAQSDVTTTVAPHVIAKVDTLNRESGRKQFNVSVMDSFATEHTSATRNVTLNIKEGTIYSSIERSSQDALRYYAGATPGSGTKTIGPAQAQGEGQGTAEGKGFIVAVGPSGEEQGGTGGGSGGAGSGTEVASTGVDSGRDGTGGAGASGGQIQLAKNEPEPTRSQETKSQEKQPIDKDKEPLKEPYQEKEAIPTQNQEPNPQIWQSVGTYFAKLNYHIGHVFGLPQAEAATPNDARNKETNAYGGPNTRGAPGLRERMLHALAWLRERLNGKARRFSNNSAQKGSTTLEALLMQLGLATLVVAIAGAKGLPVALSTVGVHAAIAALAGYAGWKVAQALRSLARSLARSSVRSLATEKTRAAEGTSTGLPTRKGSQGTTDVPKKGSGAGNRGSLPALFTLRDTPGLSQGKSLVNRVGIIVRQAIREWLARLTNAPPVSRLAQKVESALAQIAQRISYVYKQDISVLSRLNNSINSFLI